jgi:cation transport regulator ChaB
MRTQAPAGTDDSREGTAHKVAWSAVKQMFHKEGNSERWVETA